MNWLGFSRHSTLRSGLGYQSCDYVRANICFIGLNQSYESRVHGSRPVIYHSRNWRQESNCRNLQMESHIKHRSGPNSGPRVNKMFYTGGVDVGVSRYRRVCSAGAGWPAPASSLGKLHCYTANHSEFVCVGQRSRWLRFMCSWCHVTLIIDRNASICALYASSLLMRDACSSMCRCHRANRARNRCIHHNQHRWLTRQYSFKRTMVY